MTYRAAHESLIKYLPFDFTAHVLPTHHSKNLSIASKTTTASNMPSTVATIRELANVRSPAHLSLDDSYS